MSLYPSKPQIRRTRPLRKSRFLRNRSVPIVALARVRGNASLNEMYYVGRRQDISWRTVGILADTGARGVRPWRGLAFNNARDEPRLPVFFSPFFTMTS